MAIKVLHLIDSGGLYGAEKMLLTLVSEQIKQGLAPMILSAGEPEQPEKPLETEAKNLGLPVTPWRMKAGFNLMGAKDIFRWARSNGFQLLHSHGYKFNVLMGLWPESIRSLPLVTTLHGYIKAPRFTKSWLYESVDRFALNQMRAVVLVSETMRQQIPRAISESERVAVIPNGLDVDAVQLKAQCPLSETYLDFLEAHSPVVLAVGRLSPEKGFDRLIQAFSLVIEDYPNAGLIIIGEGAMRGQLERQAKEADLSSNLLLPGYSDQVPALMSKVDMLCMPSLTEGLPITLLEAMAVEVPILATNVGEIGQVLGRTGTHTSGGVVIPENDGAALLDGMKEVLSSLGAQKIAANWARDRVQSAYSSVSMARQYSAVYQQAIG
ncbi:glycosyltransferase [Marinobacter litoralis]|uniref:glycosyltransferase n=1 Tax=Marinobacter litoralis TaxID=187981 RepID=UPI0018EE10F2|nr:glycosyltransferase [Marinobacter litoralis]MBJ6137686.1 glycosyltransferase [Marinobacter litoralis]